jgi:hypothetical protein
MWDLAKIGGEQKAGGGLVASEGDAGAGSAERGSCMTGHSSAVYAVSLSTDKRCLIACATPCVCICVCVYIYTYIHTYIYIYQLCTQCCWQWIRVA